MLDPRLFLSVICLGLFTGMAPHLSGAAEPLRVGMELSYPPFEMTDPAGKPTGVSVRLAEALGAELAGLAGLGLCVDCRSRQRCHLRNRRLPLALPARRPAW